MASAAGGTVLKQRHINHRVVGAGLLAIGVALVLGGGAGPVRAQIIPTTTTTTEPDITTTSVVPETTTTTSTPEETTTSTSPVEDTTTSTSSTAPSQPTTTRARSTTSTVLPPAGVPSTMPPAAEEVLDADLGKLPLFVGLSLFGIFVTIAIVTTQWVRTRSGSGGASSTAR